MFVDECVIKVQAGDGGRGAVSFRLEKYERWGGPNGGDGRRCGDVILLGDDDTNNLIDYKYKPHWNAQAGFAGQRACQAYKYKPHWNAQAGEPGRGSDQFGKEGEHCILRLPLGTVLIDEETGKVVAELVEDGQRIDLPTPSETISLRRLRPEFTVHLGTVQPAASGLFEPKFRS